MLDRMRSAPEQPNQQTPSNRPPPPHKTERDPRRQGVYPLILPGEVFQNLQKLLRNARNRRRCIIAKQRDETAEKDIREILEDSDERVRKLFERAEKAPQEPDEEQAPARIWTRAPDAEVCLPRLWGGHLSGSPHPPKISAKQACE